MAMHQQESERDHQEEDVKRSFRRVVSVVNRKFEELIAGADAPGEKEKLVGAKAEVIKFVEDELEGFEKDRKMYDAGAKKRLEKLSKLQEKSMRDLLTSVSGVKYEALEQMINDVFAAARKASDMDVPDKVLDELEELADAMYEQRTTLQVGRQRLDVIRKQIQGGLSQDLAQIFDSASDADEFAEGIDQLSDAVRLARGKKEIAAIEEQWSANMEEARANSIAKAEEDGEERAYDDEVRVTVEMLLKIHTLVSEGKVPVHLLDFEAIDLTTEERQGEEEQVEGEAGSAGEGEQAEAEQPEEEPQGGEAIKEQADANTVDDAVGQEERVQVDVVEEATTRAADTRDDA